MSAMLYASTRGRGEPVGFSEALASGLAPDGGLYVPTRWPGWRAREGSSDLPRVAAEVLAPFLEGDALAGELPAITAEAFAFPAPLVPLENAQVLELFHGPTAAFKDFGARFMAACVSRARKQADRELHILVATSGDTGGAVAAAFHNRPGVRVSVLYPKGLVSPTQERQLTCWGGNVSAFSVRGAFDDCQGIVKEAFADADLTQRYDLSSANSINVGRLLPQMAYIAATSLAVHAQYGEPASFVIPSGNLGHSTAAAWARQIGLPIDRIVLAHNANRTMPDYLTSGEWRPRETIPTIASAMDVGNPSNGERLRHLFPRLEDLRAFVTAYTIDDDAICERIRAGWQEHGQFWCPHTAAAVEAYVRHTASGANAGSWVIAATAHAGKFPEIVAPLVGAEIPVPQSLASLRSDGDVTEIEPTLAAFRAALRT